MPRLWRTTLRRRLSAEWIISKRKECIYETIVCLRAGHARESADADPAVRQGAENVRRASGGSGHNRVVYDTADV